jgi:FAD/FMN-containing dehydrogenase
LTQQPHGHPVIGSSLQWRALRAAIDGEVVVPGSAGYESARKPFFARLHDSYPAAVVFCSNPADVVQALRFAVHSGMRPVARSGGHCFAGRSTGAGIVIDVSRMRSVDVANGLATVGAGAKLGDIYNALDGVGVTIPGGSCPSVGIAGLTLGGGLGILGRKLGLTSDSLEAVEIVLGDGRIVECDADHESELFWALRGGGAGGFGVVTRLRFRTHRALPATSFRLGWSHHHAAELITAWQRWAPLAPDELYAALLLSAAGDALTVTVRGSDFGDEADARARLDDFVDACGVEPATEIRTRMPFRETARFWAGDEAEQQALRSAHLFVKSEFFRQPLPPEAIAALLANFTSARVAGEERELDFTPWGGAYNRAAANATAFPHRAELFSLKHTVAVAPDRASSGQSSARQWLKQSWTSVHPWGTGRVFPNFPDPTLDDPGRAYYADNYERLLRIKTRYDPDAVFPPVA